MRQKLFNFSLLSPYAWIYVCVCNVVIIKINLKYTKSVYLV